MQGRNRTWLLALSAIAVVGWLVGRAETPHRETPPSPASSSGFAFRGAASCSGRACHGGLDAAGTKGCEYTTWLLHDPHQRAFSVLVEGKAGERSRRMVKALHPEAPELRPETDAGCLHCHAPEKQTAGGQHGFGCEACHGPAEKWLVPHSSPSEWAKRSDREKRDLGFHSLERLEDRARACVDCHVGTGASEVNHDLIAAGHPRLHFEFETYLANLPRHWQPAKDAEPAAAWLVGQAVSSEAALKLLASRAGNTAAPWPEFAEHDCFACHHDLTADSRRQQRGFGARLPGTMPLAEWYFTMPAVLAEQEKAGADLKKRLAELSRQMDRPAPDRAAVAKTATAAAAAIEPWFKSAKAPRCSAVFLKLIAEGRTPFVKQGQKVTITSWDAAAQVALALRAEAAAQAKGRAPAAELEGAVRELFRLLQFSKDGSNDSPVAFDGTKFVEEVELVCGLLDPPP